MRTIAMTYHHEGQTWWAESAELPGFTAAASTFEELRKEVVDGVAFELDDEPFRIQLFDESGAALDTAAFSPVANWWSLRDTTVIGEALAFGRRPRQFSGEPAMANY